MADTEKMEPGSMGIDSWSAWTCWTEVPVSVLYDVECRGQSRYLF